jgi:CRISPR/Cas system CMR-associated protein Cmr1 (group 7 of RAMP superfamily)
MDRNSSLIIIIVQTEEQKQWPIVVSVIKKDLLITEVKALLRVLLTKYRTMLSAIHRS